MPGTKGHSGRRTIAEELGVTLKKGKKSNSGNSWSNYVGRDFENMDQPNEFKEAYDNLKSMTSSGDMKQKIEAFKVITEAKKAGMDPTIIKEWEIQFGLKQAGKTQTNENKQQSQQTPQGFTPMQYATLQQMQLETDPQIKRILAISLMPDINKNPILMTQMMQTTQAQPPIQNQSDQILSLAVESLKSSLNRKEPDQLGMMEKMFSMMEKLNILPKDKDVNTIDTFFKTIDKAKEVGLVSDHGESIEDREMNLKEKLAENEFKKYEIDQGLKADHDKGIAKTVEKGMNIALHTLQQFAKTKAPQTIMYQTLKMKNYIKNHHLNNPPNNNQLLNALKLLK